jgi:hypothetical protein
MTLRQTHLVVAILTSEEVEAVEEVHHGDCVGADKEFHGLVEQELGGSTRIVVHPPENSRNRAYCRGDEIREPLPYMERSQNVVDETDGLIATPREMREVLRSGTWATIRRGRKKAGGDTYPIWIVLPDGTIHN